MTGVTHEGFWTRLLLSRPAITLLVVLAITAALAAQIRGIRMYSEFADLLPQTHPYIELHNGIRDEFGGANVIVLAMEVEEGTIFTNEALLKLHRLTTEVDKLPGVNHNLVTSLVHRTSRRSSISGTGSIISDPYYDPNGPRLNQQQLEQLSVHVRADPSVYGLLVAPDLKSALIKAQLNENNLDYELTFNELQKIRSVEQGDGFTIHATGQPVLIGWTYFYLPELTQIFLITILIMLVLLIYYFRRLYGILLPLLSTVLSALWGLGFLGIMGYNIDPLTLVIPFLVSARALSHSVQMVERYYEEIKRGETGKTAAKTAFESLSRPGLLAILGDSAGIWLIALSSIPLNVKMANYCAFWALSIAVTVLVVVPVVLLLLPTPKSAPPELGLRKLLPVLANTVVRPAMAKTILAISGLLLVASAYFTSWIVVGENSPGSPILYPDHDYNLSSAAINKSFPGSEDLYIIARTDNQGGIKRPEVLLAIENFQNFMLEDPIIGGSKAVTDMVKKLNQLVHSEDPRWAHIPDTAAYAGGLMFAYMATNAIPNALKEYITPEEDAANVVFYLKDHQGDTIRRTFDRIHQWQASPAAQVDGFRLDLAGGLIGVNAAINEEVISSNNKIVPSVLGFVFVSVLLFYRSLHAGLLMLLTMLFATLLTHAFMGIKGTGMNINTVPVIAIGIGIGIDYAIYIMDRIKETMAEYGDITEAVRAAMTTTGLAITFTATTLVMGVAIWIVMSSMRFQADAATLLVSMMLVNMVAAMIFVPAWVIVFKPAFLVGKK
ncbi:MAG: MMPL family transporter [Gammaproteobacteria bacterium]